MTTNPSGKRSRWAGEVFLLAIFLVSRLLYYWAGIRFDARPLTSFFQILDLELLRHRLLETIFYLHVQPPAFNLLIGVLLKIFPILTRQHFTLSTRP